MQSRIMTYLQIPIWLMLVSLVMGMASSATYAATNCSATIETGIPQAECETLVAFYNSTGGPTWSSFATDNWTLDNRPCNWKGVTCNGGHVTGISLRSNNLTGSLPDLSGLSYLEFLYLYANKIAGNIPSLDALTRLEYIQLYDNQLSGSIPNLDKLVNLIYLQLNDNKLTGNIPSLDKLTSLKRLYLQNNQLTGSVPSLKELPSYLSINFNNNPLSGSIPDFSHLNRSTVSFTGTNITGPLKAELFPKTVYTIDLAGNKISGSIPSDFATNLTNLSTLDLENNQITGGISDSLSKVSTLDLDNNHLCGDIPASLVNVSSLGISHNHLTIPSDTKLAATLSSKDSDYQTTQSPNSQYCSGIVLPTPTNIPPVANFTFSTNDKTVSLSASGSYDSDGSIVQYNWSANGQTPSGQTASINFTSYGTYPVTLVVIDNYGSADTLTQNVTLQQTVKNFTLSGSTDGNGKITINNTENCGTNCTKQYAENTAVTLVVSPNSGYEFDKWAGACSGSTTTCSVTMNSDKSVQAFFKQTIVSNTYTINVQTSGDGTVSVNGQTCSEANCTINVTVQQGESVTFTALPKTGYEFSNWGGVCSGSAGSTCTTTLTGNSTVQANFSQQAPDSYTLTTNVTGSGSVTAAGRNCSAGCSFNAGSSVTLTANASEGFEFDSWSGCTSTANTCAVVMSSGKAVTANFVAKATETQSLTINVVDNEGKPLANTDISATVMSSPSGILCSETASLCQADFVKDEVIKLSTSTIVGTEFLEWTGGGCSGSGECSVTMSQDRQVTAVFQGKSVETNQLSLFVKGSGYVSVTGEGVQQDCITDCEVTYERSTNTMTLVANPQVGFKFKQWDGDGTCTGSGDCTLPMNRDAMVRAIFEPFGNGFNLNLKMTGSGSGKVTAEGMTCSEGECDSRYPEGLAVTLTAEFDKTSMFTGWQGACESFGDQPQCTVVMNSDLAVSAEFSLDNAPGKRIFLNKIATDINGNVVEDVAGSGLVHDIDLSQKTNGQGVYCDTQCATDKGIYGDTSIITLQATSHAGSIFEKWSGDACSGSLTTCKVNLAQQQDVEVNAHYIQTLPPLPTVVVTAAGEFSTSEGKWAGGVSIVDTVNNPPTYSAYRKNQSLIASEQADVQIAFRVDPDHVGQEADLLVLAGVGLPSSIFPSMWYMLDENRLPWVWNGAIPSIIPFQKVVLLTNKEETVQVFSGFLPIGTLTIHVGYRLTNGTVVFNDKPIKVKVSE